MRWVPAASLDYFAFPRRNLGLHEQCFVPRLSLLRQEQAQSSRAVLALTKARCKVHADCFVFKVSVFMEFSQSGIACAFSVTGFRICLLSLDEGDTEGGGLLMHKGFGRLVFLKIKCLHPTFFHCQKK